MHARTHARTQTHTHAHTNTHTCTHTHTRTHTYIHTHTRTHTHSRINKHPLPKNEQEHRRFLEGLERFGKGDWRNISKHCTFHAQMRIQILIMIVRCITI